MTLRLDSLVLLEQVQCIKAGGAYLFTNMGPQGIFPGLDNIASILLRASSGCSLIKSMIDISWSYVKIGPPLARFAPPSDSLSWSSPSLSCLSVLSSPLSTLLSALLYFLSAPLLAVFSPSDHLLCTSLLHLSLATPSLPLPRCFLLLSRHNEKAF